MELGQTFIITMTMCGQWACDSDQWERVAVFQRSWQSATDYSLLIPRGPGRETLRIINDIVLTCHLSLVLTDIHLLYWIGIYNSSLSTLNTCVKLTQWHIPLSGLMGSLIFSPGASGRNLTLKQPAQAENPFNQPFRHNFNFSCMNLVCTFIYFYFYLQLLTSNTKPQISHENQFYFFGFWAEPEIIVWKKKRSLYYCLAYIVTAKRRRSMACLDINSKKVSSNYLLTS